MAHAIILSKDRAAQLHLCIESILKNHNSLFDNISVLFHTSSSEYNRGYIELASIFPQVTFLEETSYYKDVIYLLDSFSLTSFFTDDDILYRQIPVKKEWIEHMLEDMANVGCLSLRLGMNTYIQDPYIGSKVIEPPSGFMGNGHLRVWNWKEVPTYTNFGYPLSVDGHIFRTPELRRILSECKFNNPNQQEIAMMSKADSFPARMTCFEYSVLVNTPLNRVQQTCMNRSGEKCGQAPHEMNQRYLKGEKLDLQSIDCSNIVGCHQELEIKWIMK